MQIRRKKKDFQMNQRFSCDYEIYAKFDFQLQIVSKQIAKWKSVSIFAYFYYVNT